MTTRRDVLRGLSGLAVMGALPVGACGGDDGDGGMDASTHDASHDATTRDATTDSGGGGGACDSVSHTTDLHSHGLVLPTADVTAGVEKTYTLTGGHTHAMTVTAAMFAMLQTGQTAMLTSGESSAGGHTHMVTLTCES